MRQFIFLWLLIYSSTLLGQEGYETLPRDLLGALLKTPENIDLRDLDKLKDWHRTIEKAIQQTVKLKNPEYSTEKYVFFGNVEPVSDNQDSFMAQCAAEMSRYNWIQLYSDSIREVIDDIKMILQTWPEAQPQREMMLRLGHALEYLGFLRDQFLRLVNAGKHLDQEISVLFTWQINKQELVRSIHPAFNYQIQSIEPLSLQYPGQNWHPEVGYGFSEHPLVAGPPRYRNGSIELQIKDDWRTFCIGQIYLELQMKIATSYQYSQSSNLRDGEQESWVHLYGHRFDSLAFKLQQSRVFLADYQTERDFTVRYQRISPYFAYNESRRMQQLVNKCHATSKDLFFISRTACQLFEKDRIRYEHGLREMHDLANKAMQSEWGQVWQARMGLLLLL